MSGSGTIYTEQSVLGHTLGFAPMAFPARVFVGLCSAAMPPSETVKGVEAFGNGYARMQAQFALIDTPANIAANVATVEYPLATGAGWGTLGFFELWDAPAGGNRLYWGALIDTSSQLPTTLTVSGGDIVRFSAGTLAVQAATGAGGTSSVGAYLPLAGGSLTGPLLLASDPTSYLQAATKQYVDAHSGTGGGPGFLPLSGGTMLGSLSLSGNATQPLQAVPLQQVDTLNVVNVLNHGAKGDGTTNDTAAIQGVLNAYAGKATVFVPDTGQPYMCNAFGLPSGTDMLLNGTIKAIAHAAGHLVNIYPGAANVTIRGHGTLDGNRPNQTGLIAGIYATSCTNLKISGITIQHSSVWNLNIVTCTHVLVDGVTMLDCASSNEFADGCDDCWLTNCYVDGVNDIGFCFYGGVTNSGAIGNTITNIGTSALPQTGICVLGDAAQPAACRNIVIAGNVMHDCWGSGSYNESSAGSLNDGIVFANNICRNNGKSGSGPQSDIGFDHCINVLAIGNQSSNFGNGADTAYGLYAGANARGISFIGNHVVNTGQGTTTGIGLYVASANLLWASGNYFYDQPDDPTTSMAAAIGGNAGTRNSYVGNFCDRPVTIALQPDTVSANVVNAIWTVAGGMLVGGFGINYNNSAHSVAFNWTGTALTAKVDGTAEGNVLTDIYMVTRPNAANDAAAASAGVPVGGVYRNGSILMCRVV